MESPFSYYFCKINCLFCLLFVCAYSAWDADETYHHMLNRTFVDCIDHISLQLSSTRITHISAFQLTFCLHNEIICMLFHLFRCNKSVRLRHTWTFHWLSIRILFVAELDNFIIRIGSDFFRWKRWWLRQFRRIHRVGLGITIQLV